MALSTAKQQLIDQLEARIDAINLSTATDSQVLVAGAMYKMAAQVATSQFIDQNSVQIFQNMTPAEFTTWYDDVNNVTALRRLFTDTIFWMELADNATAVGSMLVNAKFTADMLTSSNVYQAMISGAQTDLAVDTIMSSTTIRDLWYAAGSTPVLTLFNRPRFSSHYAIDPAVVTTIMASSTARTQFVTSQQFNTSIDNTTIVQNYIADSTSRTVIFGSAAAMIFLCAKTTPLTAFLNNATARNEMFVSGTQCQYMFVTANAYNLIYSNQTYYNTVLTSVTTVQYWSSSANNAQKIAAYDNTTLMTSWLANGTFRATLWPNLNYAQVTHNTASTSYAAVAGLTQTTRYIYVAGQMAAAGTLDVTGVHGASSTSLVNPSWQGFYARCGTGSSVQAKVTTSTGYMYFHAWAT